jgi:hypothetical protein
LFQFNHDYGSFSWWVTRRWWSGRGWPFFDRRKFGRIDENKYGDNSWGYVECVEFDQWW